MPRKGRFDKVCDKSTHHVVQRGVNKSRVFRDDEDHDYFKKLMLRHIKEHGNIKIYNYCLMPNHIHFLLFVDDAQGLSKFMQSILLAYGHYYRKKYGYSGYLWHGRFKNFPIESDSYLLECARYIERNPLRVKHRLVENLSDFRWSSYNFYSRGLKDEVVTVNPLYEDMGATSEERQAAYKDYVLTTRPWDEVLDRVFEADSAE
jgi:putative transposase